MAECYLGCVVFNFKNCVGEPRQRNQTAMEQINHVNKVQILCGRFNIDRYPTNDQERLQKEGFKFEKRTRGRLRDKLTKKIKVCSFIL